MIYSQGEQDDDWIPEEPAPANYQQYWRIAINLLITAALITAGVLLRKLAPDKVNS